MRTIESIKWLWRASAGVRGRICLNSVLGTIDVCASMAFVWVCKRMMDAITSGESADLKIYISLMVVCMLMQAALSAFEQHSLNYSDIVLKNRLRQSLFVRLMGSRWNGKETFHTGDTLNRVMEDVRIVTEAVTRSVPSAITSCIHFSAAFVFMFNLAPGLAWSIPGIMLVALFVSKRYVEKMRQLNKDIRTAESGMQAHMQESLQHRLVIHTLERVPYVSGVFQKQQDALFDRTMHKTRFNVSANAVIRIGFSSGYAFAFLWGVLGIRSGVVTFGMMTAFLQLVGQLQRPIMILSRQISPLVNSITSAERLYEIESQPVEQIGEPCRLANPTGVRFKDVAYAYPDDGRNILDKFTYDFMPGSSTALIGETGAGKSTMMKLILALLEPDEGKVELYDSDRDVPASPDTRCNIIYVPQGNTLMSGTIRDNLLIGNPSASEDDLRNALYLAAADFVNELPEGLDTSCGERGEGLSEGQAQRISIARSLLRDGHILLLDEPTSALDSETEETMIKRLMSASKERTMIIITHRESVAALCDNILRLPPRAFPPNFRAKILMF